LLERSGVAAERASQTIGAALAGPEAADALQVEIGSPLLSLTRVVFDPDHRGVEHLHALYRPDRYSFQMDLVRSGGSGGRRWKPVPAPRPVGPPAPQSTPKPTRRKGRPVAARRHQESVTMSETSAPTRRALLQGGVAGAALLAMPAVLRAQTPPAVKVASSSP
jgi:GntR family transcriptional regulator